MTIYDVELGDAGLYEITADNGDTNTTQEINLLVTCKYHLYYL